MPYVTVTCRCLHPLRQERGAPPGYLACGNCGTRVRINMDRSPVCSAGKSNGAKCTAELFMFDPVPLCEEHRNELLLNPTFTGGLLYTQAHLNKVREETMRQYVHVPLDWGRQREGADLAEMERRKRDLREQVYYIAIRGHIKIGYTSNISTRMVDLIPDALLATEPGTRKLETRRHRQFDHLRGTFGREYFRVAPELLEHVEAVRAEHGPPSLTHYMGYEEWRRQTSA